MQNRRRDASRAAFRKSSVSPAPATLLKQTIDTQQAVRKHPIFNDKYEITTSLGHGKTSKVYLANEIGKPESTVAIKIFREEYLLEAEENVHCIEQEIEILRGLKHNHIVSILDYGSEGLVVKPSGRKIQNLVYIIMQHIKGNIFFETCEKLGAMGEDAGRFFMHQLIDGIEYMHKKGVVHRDLKLENILIDQKMNLKIVDFGFATYKSIKKLHSYKGTKTYMAPEIKKRLAYDGRQVDVFSTAVILFIIVNGIFPFKEASNTDVYFQLIKQGHLDKYWAKVGVTNVSWEFRELIIKMLSPTASERPTFQQIREHPWMKKEVNIEQIRSGLIEKTKEAKTSQSSASTNSGNNNSRDAEKHRPVNADDFMSPVRGVNAKLPEDAASGSKGEPNDQKKVNELVRQTEKMKIRV